MLYVIENKVELLSHLYWPRLYTTGTGHSGSNLRCYGQTSMALAIHILLMSYWEILHNFTNFDHFTRLLTENV